MNRLADAVLAAHFLLAAFIAGMLILVPLGAWRGWHWIRLRALRILHLCAIVFVAAETLAGLACPLTLLEDRLRGRPAGGAGFIERTLGAVLYWDLPAWAFELAYLAAAAAALAMWRAIPPAAGGSHMSRS
ncbi:MAG: DUF2784 domain-containing protein [Rhodocyclaceae bacterium]